MPAEIVEKRGQIGQPLFFELQHPAHHPSSCFPKDCRKSLKNNYLPILQTRAEMERFMLSL